MRRSSSKTRPSASLLSVDFKLDIRKLRKKLFNHPEICINAVENLSKEISFVRTMLELNKLRLLLSLLAYVTLGQGKSWLIYCTDNTKMLLFTFQHIPSGVATTRNLKSHGNVKASLMYKKCNRALNNPKRILKLWFKKTNPV